jgi:hypothetical protein
MRTGARGAAWTAILMLGATMAAATAVPGGTDRPPAVAGGFYPADRAELAAQVQRFLAQAHAPIGGRPLAIVAPHAGYAYCGRILGEAWRQAAGQDYDLLVILGTNHRVAGLDAPIVWPDGAWRTPLGTVTVDAAAARALLAADPACRSATAPHATEHSLEVQLPFAQTVYPRLPILPVMVATQDPGKCERLGRALAVALRGRRPLIVASSDLSHYPAAVDAERVDRATLAAIAALDPAALTRTIDAAMRGGVRDLATCACGEAPIRVAMAAAAALGATRGVVVAYANSAQAPGGDPARVVGYGAVACCAGPPPAPVTAPAPVPGSTPGAAPGAARSLSASDRSLLLRLARETIRRHFDGGGDLPATECAPATLAESRGAFVTLKRDGALRGCIGHLGQDLPLCRVVREMATAAAFQDRRFPPLARGELDGVTIEISALTRPRAIADLAEIVLGRDGVILRKGMRSAVFLPQVAVEQGWNRDTMLTQLSLKAGLPADAWRTGAEFQTFQAEVFGEPDRR